jgi:predicted MFS family arabinose efflux permease
MAFGGLYTGQLLDKFDRKNLLLTLATIWSLTSVITGYTSSFEILVLMRFL